MSLDKTFDMEPQPKLAHTRQLLFELGQPQTAFECVHIAGTNGKGSTAAFLSRILQAAGYRTGMFTSPHIYSYKERIQVNGEPINDEALESLSALVNTAVKEVELPPNYFRDATAIALSYFKEAGCDIAVLETGLGGRLDPTNAVKTPLLTIITHIGMDHEAFLGDTIEQIAAQKAGIIKQGTKLIFIAQDRRVESVIEETARSRLVTALRVCPFKIISAQGELKFDSPLGELTLGIGGAYQAQNAALALKAAMLLNETGLNIECAHIKEGLLTAQWPGRFELIRDTPPIILDGAHNPQGMEALLKSISMQWPGHSLIWVMGAMRDKAYEKCLEIAAPSAKAFIAVPIEDQRALHTGELAKHMRKLNGMVYQSDSVEQGLSLASVLQESRDIICVCGSLYLAAPARDAAKALLKN